MLFHTIWANNNIDDINTAIARFYDETTLSDDIAPGTGHSGKSDIRNATDQYRDLC